MNSSLFESSISTTLSGRLGPGRDKEEVGGAAKGKLEHGWCVGQNEQNVWIRQPIRSHFPRSQSAVWAVPLS